ncbi:sodium leak channel NALCN-like isoform X2 [Convolutriloba macropyga]|uniref:sodium leak channel NALCN-like isoform X2 n=1 Tax=Convolutriloba macropyga TaxID=536237 RepID=UPI003F521532
MAEALIQPQQAQQLSSLPMTASAALSSITAGTPSPIGPGPASPSSAGTAAPSPTTNPPLPLLGQGIVGGAQVHNSGQPLAVTPQSPVAGGVSGLPASPTVNAIADAAAAAAAFDDNRLEPNAVAISPLNPKWLEIKWIQGLLLTSCFVSFVSVCINTPKMLFTKIAPEPIKLTIENYQEMRHLLDQERLPTYEPNLTIFWTLFSIDVFLAALFSLETLSTFRFAAKRESSIGESKKRPFTFWMIFDAFMSLSHWISLVIQWLFLVKLIRPYSPIVIMRLPRTLIILRPLRHYLSFRVTANKSVGFNSEDNKVSKVFRRSGKQVWNVTMFLLFFLSLYGLVGVQFFGALNHHCVREGAQVDNIQIDDLMIPDTHCNPDPEADFGYQCPPMFVCKEIQLRWDQRDYNGFDHFIYSIFTVYESASQEGWILTMYKTQDTFEFWKSYVYFFTLIFFLAWLVKNVFIAVVIETFAELRVQFQQICGTKNFGLEDAPTQRFSAVGPATWEIVTVDENKRRGLAPEICLRIAQSSAFHLTALMLVLADAMIAASKHYTLADEERIERYNHILYYSQIMFTVLFDLEALFKIFCLGYAAYIERGLHKFEFLVAVGSTIRLIPSCYETQFTYFQVLRVVRLIKMSPVTEEFVFKIFGPTKKLGTLIMFTMSTLILTSALSLQLFCHIDDLKHFENFVQAFMAMFQILTQEGWVEVMDTTMWKSGEWFAPFVAVYFVFYHLFATLIVLCLFVAVILDNLELDEDVKRIKQLKAREHKVGTEDKLPWRLALFEKFPDTPQMVHVNKLSRNSDFPSDSKVRDSFMRNFITSGAEFEVLVKLIESVNEQIKPRLKEAWEEAALCGPGDKTKELKNKLATEDKREQTKHQPNYFTRRLRSLAALKDCIRYQSMNEQGNGSGSGLGMLYRGNTAPAGNSLFATQHALRQDRRHRRSGSVKLGMKLDQTKENGHVSAFTPVKTRDLDIKILQEKTQQAEIKRSAKEENLRENHPLFDTPLFMVGRETRLRRFCQLVVNAKYNPIGRDRRTGLIKRSTYQPFLDLLALVPYLDWGMILVTIVSACSMMCETPFYRVTENEELQVTEYIFVAAMSLELTFKMLANGLFFTPNAVIKDFGGVMDMFIYLNGLVFLAWLPEDIPSHSFAQYLMVGRCMRPLRIFSLVPDMRRVVYELVRGFREIFLVSVLLVALIFIFASYGVQTLAGKLYRCNDVTIGTQMECTGNYMQKIAVVKYLHIGTPEELPSIYVPRVWANPRNFNFDNIFSAMLCLFEVLTLKSWYEIRDVIMKQTGEVNGLFVHVFVFIGCLIGVTLFVGVIIANFQENNGRALLTVDQRRWEDLKRRLSLVQPLHLPPRPGDRYSFRQYVYDQIMSKRAKRFIAFLAVAQSSLLCIKWESKNDQSIYLAILSALFNVLFTGEAIMKCVAVSFRGYWQSWRNRYDLFVTTLGILWNALFAYDKESYWELGTLVVMLRFFTICGKQATLKMLLLTVLVSVYKSFFIILSLFVLILCYALSGVILFGTVKYGENLHRRANFHNAGQAMTVLFRIVTGEDWNKIMHDCMLSPPLCSQAPNYWESDCGSFTASIIFFCSFYVILAYIVLNLLVAIIVENFSLFYSNDADALLSYNDIKMFQEKWKIVDRERKGYITTIQVRFLLRHLTGRLQVDMVNDKLLFKHMCCEAEKTHNGAEVSFHEILSMLAYRSVDIRKVLQLEELLEREELEFSIEEEVAKQTIINWFNKIVKARNLRRHTTGETFISQLRHQIEEEVIQKITNDPKPVSGGPGVPGGLSGGNTNNADDGVEKMGQFLTASDGSKKYKKGMCLKKNVSSESESNASLVYIDSWKSDTCAGSGTKVQSWWNSAIMHHSSSANRNSSIDSDDSDDSDDDD